MKLFNRKLILGVLFVLVFSLVGNLLALALPRVASDAINNIFTGQGDLSQFQATYLLFIVLILVTVVVQTVAANIVTEYFAASLRSRLINKIAHLSYTAINKVTSAKLLTNITSDVDAIKALFNQGIVQVFASLVLIIGASASMLSIDGTLGLIVIATIPLLFISFGVIFSFISKYFKIAQENLDQLNRVINESIIGAALTKVLNSASWENRKFGEVNEVSRQTSIKIVFGFASLIPFITILANAALLAVVYFGGSGVIDFIKSQGQSGLTPGDYTAFFSYVGTFIGPVLILGFISSTIARSVTSLKRIQETLDIEDMEARGDKVVDVKGHLEFKKVSLEIGNKSILKEISFEIQPGTRTAIVGPTAAGKTQIFNLIAGLQEPTGGEIALDGNRIQDISSDSFYSQVALVFQDSIIFNTSVRENILFSSTTSPENLDKAIATAELSEFVAAQDQGLETRISERGSSLSGGQKQRLTLARALSLNPKVLLLDDFTARVDRRTEANIIGNLSKNYPGMTLVSITQKIDSIKDYDQILLIMEGELIGKGTHAELLKDSFEYQQIFNSQQSTEAE